MNLKLFFIAVKKEFNVLIFYVIYCIICIFSIYCIVQNNQKLAYRFSIIGICVQLYAFAIMMA